SFFLFFFSLLPRPRTSPLFPYTTLFRSAARHGGASNVDVVMEKSDGSLAIKILDNGKGFGSPLSQAAHQELATANVRTTSLYERSEEHTSELQSPYDLVCRLLLEKKKKE